MRRGAKPAKAKAETKPPVARKSLKSADSRVRDLEKRLAEALEQQAATSEILRVIASSPTDIRPVFDAVAETAVRLCESSDAEIFRRDGDRLLLVAHHGPIPSRTVAVPLVRGTFNGRTVLDGRTFHVADLQSETDEFPRGSELARQHGTRAQLSVPLMREGVAIGTISLRRTEARLFAERQVALLKTFADQAVIAIENVRLFNETKEALEQQTATSEILRVISSSPTDIQPVLDALAESASRLCRSVDCNIFLPDGDRLVLRARYGPSRGEADVVGQFVLALVRGTVAGRTVLERRTVHVIDLLAEADEFPEAHQNARRFGFRTMLSVPLIRESAALGVIQLRRTEVNPFTDRQAELLKTFADQAVIAIENVRLFNELEGRNRDLTATSEILRVISSSPTDVQPVFDTIVRSAVRLCDGLFSALHQFDGELLHLVAHHNYSPEALEEVRRLYPARPSRGQGFGRAILERELVHIPDVEVDPEYQAQALSRAIGFRSGLFVPMLREGVPIGAIMVARAKPGPFSDNEIELLKTFADQAVIAIENVRLFTELEARNSELRAALEQQTATGEILRVISGSPTDEQPVFEAIVESAQRLCEATYSTLLLTDSGRIRVAAVRGVDEAGVAAMQQAYPRPIARDTTTGRAVLDRCLVHIADSALDPEYTHPLRDTIGLRSILSVPIFREEQPIGAISVWRPEPRPFTDTQIALLQTFADQAVIALENVRLFKELEARNSDLTEALEQQTATSEILRVISQSPTDVQPVFDVIGERAERLCDAEISIVSRVDGELIQLAALHGVSEQAVEVVRRIFPMPRDAETLMARAVRRGVIVHVPDVLADAEYGYKDTARATGQRGCLAVPMVREGQVIGAIFVARRQPGLFSNTQVELLKTFADQAVIAIRNVRLFKELEVRNGDLTEALEQQTATAEILRVISSSPTDTQPVFDIIAANAARLCAARDAQVLRVEGDVLRLVSAYGSPSMPPVRAISRGHAVGRAVIDRQTIHVRDMAQAVAEFPETSSPRHGVESLLAVPLLRGDVAVGVIRVSRTQIQPFTEQQIALLATFADQAVIAIVNVRLFTELEARNRELTSALDQQTATSDILRVISRSQTDVQPVFDAILGSAVRLLRGYSGTLTRLVGDQIELVALTSTDDSGDAALRAAYPQPLQSEGTAARAMRDRATLNIADAHTDPRVSEAQRAYVRVRDYRSWAVVPLLRPDEAVGTISVTRRDPGGFTDDEIALLKTFADQAVIAIENVRLFNELEGRNRDLTATSEILRVISSSPTDVQPVFDTIVRSAVRLCDGLFSGLLKFDGELLHYVAHHNFTPEALEEVRRVFPARASRGYGAGRAIVERAVVHIPDVELDPEFQLPALYRTVGWRSGLFVPMLREGAPIGVIAVTRAEPGPFSGSEIELLKTFADQAVIAVENVRLFKELEARNRDLTESLEQQTATAEILRVISQSQTDVQPVFDTIVSSAVRLCDGLFCSLVQFDGELLHFVAQHNYTPGALEEVHRIFPVPATRAFGTGRAILARAVVQIPDMELDTEYQNQAMSRALGARSSVFVPMLREGDPIGAIAVARAEPGLFSDREIELLKTFADQAVIAVENVRLFKELQARTHELSQSVEKLTALGEVSRAVTSTLDVETVLDTIVSRASQLAGAAGCSIFEYDEAAEQFELRATHNDDTAFVEALRAVPLRKGEGLMGRAAEMREPVQVADITQPGAYESSARDTLIRFGYRAVLSVPLLREDQIIGSLSFNRKAPGEFPPEVVDVLKTFATQSALAIQNARLFREIADKSRQLEAASRHKSEFLANMSHELRTPLNAIIGFSEVLVDRMFGELTEKQDEYLKDIYASGQHLLSLINDILDLSKIEAGRMELELVDFDLLSAIDNALILVRERATRRGITLGRTIDERLGTLRGDERKVKQVLLNLLSNALKFTPEGGRIDVSAGVHDEVAEVSVTDTGVGIAPEDQEAVFEEFRQVGTADKKVEGTGLGLALSRKFIELHGGRIWVKSQVGHGSTFTFTLPVRREE